MNRQPLPLPTQTAGISNTGREGAGGRGPRGRSTDSAGETTFHTDLRGVPALLSALDQLGRELCERLRAQGRTGRTVGIKVRLDDFSTQTRARTLLEPTNDAAVVGSVAGELLRRFDREQTARRRAQRDLDARAR